MSNKKLHHEFSIVIDGLALPPDTATKINKALQKVILVELASVDLGGNEIAFSPIMARMMAEDSGAAARLLRETAAAQGAPRSGCSVDHRLRLAVQSGEPQAVACAKSESVDSGG